MSNQHTGLPNTPEEIRAFIGKSFSSLQFGQETEQPHENDSYTLTAHDLISAFQWLEIDSPVSAEPVLRIGTDRNGELAIFTPRFNSVIARFTPCGKSGMKEGLLYAAPVAAQAPVFSVGVRGVGLIDDNPSALAIYFYAAPNNDDIRALHEVVSGTPAAAQAQPTRRELDMAMLIKNLARQVRRAEPYGTNYHRISDDALDALKRWGLDGSPVRTTKPEGTQSQQVDKSTEMQRQLVDRTPDLHRQQQPESSADQFRDAAQMIEPSGNSGELNFQAEYEAFKDAAWNKSGSPIGLMDGKNAAWWAWVNRAALAQQDAALQAEVLGMVRMLEVNEWADHCGESDLGKRLEWAITALQNQLQNIPKNIPGSSQQDADKVDAEPDMFWDADNPEQCQDSIHNLLVEVQCDRTLRVGDIVEIQQAMSLPNISVRVTAVDGEDDGELRYEIVNDAARKDQA